MAHLLCKAHRRRTMVVNSRLQIHRDGTPCNGEKLLWRGISLSRNDVIFGSIFRDKYNEL